MKSMLAAVVCLALTWPVSASASSFFFPGVNEPDIQVSGVQVNYDATTDRFEASTTPPNSVSAFTQGDGTQTFLFDTAITIDVAFDAGSVLDRGNLMPSGGGMAGLIIEGAQSFGGTREELLTALLNGASFDNDTVLLSWDVTGGVLAPQYNLGPGSNGRALTLVASTNFDPLNGFNASFSGANALTDTQGVIPLPAGLPLMLTALGGFAVVRHMRRKQQDA